MMMFLFVFIGLNALTTVIADCSVIKEKYPSGNNTNFYEAMEFLADTNWIEARVANTLMKVSWDYKTDMTELNRIRMMNAMEEVPKFYRTTLSAASFAWKDFKDENELFYRWFKSHSNFGVDALSKMKSKEMVKYDPNMGDTYSKAKICRLSSTRNKVCDLSLEPELNTLFASSRNETELKYYWSQWRDATGKKMKDTYINFVEMSNEMFCQKGFKDTGEFWRESYESETFVEEIEELWQTIKPFYEQLHAYVRRKLMQRYPHVGIKADGPIPAHLFAHISAIAWNNIFNIVQPYPNKKVEKKIMLKKILTPLDMFKISEDFFTSLGLPEMTPEFWRNSIIEKPKNKEMDCHASASDFSDGKDYRIKMCARANMADFLTIHHEMGHVIYGMLYSHQLFAFQKGANPGFHEAIGDTIALSVSTPTHLSTIGLADQVEESYENDINELMKRALEKIAFIPFGYLVDSWRWKVFDGSISSDEMNSGWWNLRLKYQGVCPPVKRTNEDFDPGSIYHVANNIPYIRYFVSNIIQFQFHKALCDAAGFEGPLHKCDIYGSKKAGQLLSDMLSLGSSVHWNKAMRVITQGKTSKMDASAVVEYFTPLMEWLKEQNKDEFIGWTSNDPMACP